MLFGYAEKKYTFACLRPLNNRRKSVQTAAVQYQEQQVGSGFFEHHDVCRRRPFDLGLSGNADGSTRPSVE